MVGGHGFDPAKRPGWSSCSTTGGPSIVTGLLVIGYAAGLKRVAAVGLLVWAALNFLGAMLTVLPLALLPFDPEQTLRHYSFHVLYVVT